MCTWKISREKLVIFRGGLEHLLKYHLWVDQNKKGGIEARYGEVTRKNRENKSKVCYADLSQCLLH